ncbi:MAG TPA: hypothetical protein VF316_19795 [Polyangiaceae bacterium]
MATRKSPKRTAPEWASLAHAGGNAKNVRTLLTALTKPKTSTGAFEQLRALLAAKGTAYSASGPAVAELIHLATQAKLERRDSFIELAIHVLGLGLDSVDATGIDLTRSDLAGHYASADAKSVLENATANAPVVMTLLDDEDAAVRASAAHFVGLLPDVDASVIASLAARACKEREEGAQVSLALALGMLARNVPARRQDALAAIAALDLRSDLAATARGAASTARVLAHRGLPNDVTPADLARLFAGMGSVSGLYEPTSDAAPWRRAVSWGRGRVDLVVLDGLRKHADQAAHEAIVRALAIALRTTPLVHLSELNREWPNIVLAEAGLPETKLAEQPLDAATLDERQRALLTDLSVHRHKGNFEKLGLPPDTRSRRRLLGLDAPSVMERTLPFDGEKATPVWQIVPKVVAAFERDEPGVDLFEEPTRLLAYARNSALASLSDAEWLDLWMELESGAYGLTVLVQVVKAAIFAASPPERVAFAQRWAGEIRRRREELDSMGSYVFHALSADLAADASYPEEYEDIFTFYGLAKDVPGLFAKIAAAHRETIALREIDRVPHLARRLLAFESLAPNAAAILKQREA